MPLPLLTLTFDLEVGVGVACDLGYPCAKFRLPRPFGFRVRADVRDIRQTDRRITDANDRLMPPPLRGGGITKFPLNFDYEIHGLFHLCRIILPNRLRCDNYNF